MNGLIFIVFVDRFRHFTTLHACRFSLRTWPMHKIRTANSFIGYVVLYASHNP